MITTVEEQKEIADEILSKIFLISPFSMLAGGAPRDWYFNQLANDLDIYYYRPDLNTFWVTEESFRRCGFEVTHVQSPKDRNFIMYNSNPSIEKISKSSYKGIDIHFIQVKEKVNKCVINSFPLNISSIWYEGGQFILTQDFKRAVKHKAIVKINQLYADGDAYIKKILSRFPDFKYYKDYDELSKKLLDI